MRIYVCSPYRAKSIVERNENVRFARRCCRAVYRLGLMPVAPHLYFPQFLNDDDPAERADGLRLAKELLAHCDQAWVFGDRISEGMAGEIALAGSKGIPVLKYKTPEDAL